MSHIIDWVVNLMNILGSPGVGLGILLENLFPPIPSEVILPLAGFAVSQGDLNFAAAIVWSTIGSVVGAYILFWVGAAVGAQRLRAIADWMWLVEPDDVDKALAFFDKHGTASVFFGRFIPGIRSLISIPAGLDRMNLVKFGAWTAFGSLIWNSVLITLGYYLGESYTVVSDVIDRYSKVIYVILLLIIIFFIYLGVRREMRTRARRRAATGSASMKFSDALNADQAAASDAAPRTSAAPESESEK